MNKFHKYPFGILALFYAFGFLLVSCSQPRMGGTATAHGEARATPVASPVFYTMVVPDLETAIANQTALPGILADSPVATAAPSSERTNNPSPIETSSPVSTLIQPALKTPVQTATPTPVRRLLPKYWREWPVVPALSPKALQVYQEGSKMGNNPHAFSRIGDCQSVPAIFLGLYDSQDRYRLGDDFQYLQQTIDQFAGSFGRANITAKDGFGVASVFSPLMSNSNDCQSGEIPIACEFRIWHPSFVFVAMGTNWAPAAEITFEKYLWQIMDYSLERGVVPILVTKPDNIEGDWKLNEMIARAAYEYDMPLFNAWRAVQFLENHGLEPNNIYMTVDSWNIRNFTGLETLDALWKAAGRENH